MGRSYYYFAASLPMLDFEGKPPITVESFLGDCQRLLSAEDMKDAEVVFKDKLGERPARNEFLQRWQRLLRAVRNEIVFIRAAARQQNPADFFRGERDFECCVTEALEEAEKTSDPLAAERVVDRMLWRKADELSAGHMLDFETILVYAIKLGILERYARISSPAGAEVLEAFRQQALGMKAE